MFPVDRCERPVEFSKIHGAVQDVLGCGPTSWLAGMERPQQRAHLREGCLPLKMAGSAASAGSRQSEAARQQDVEPQAKSVGRQRGVQTSSHCLNQLPSTDSTTAVRVSTLHWLHSLWLMLFILANASSAGHWYVDEGVSLSQSKTQEVFSSCDKIVMNVDEEMPPLYF